MVEESQQVYQAALEAIRRGEAAAVATVIAVRGATPRGISSKMLVHADGRTVGTVGGGDAEAYVIAEARAAITQGESRELDYRPTDEAQACGAGMRFFVDVLAPRPTLLIVGGGHVGQAVAELGAFLGYRIAVLDERPGMATPERFPWADERLTGDPAHHAAEFPLAGSTYVVIVTPHHAQDERTLAALAERVAQADKRAPAYVGLMGGRRRTAQTFERARQTDVPERFLQQIHTPIGLDIGAESPREIAVSILAEIIQCMRSEER